MGDPVAPDTPLLAMRGIVKTFPGVRALDGVDFTLRRGEIHTLMGENGAGKSTLIKVLTGVYPRNGGEVLLDGRAIHPRSPVEAQQHGISTVYQEVNLVPNLSVAENIYLGRLPLRRGRIDWKAVHAGTKEALGRLGLTIDVGRSLGAYPIAIQQLVAIARALSVEARVLVLDEPTSSLDAAEVERLFDVMRRLRYEGLGIVFVTHFLEQVYAVSDRITILRNGRLVGEFGAARLSQRELVSKMIGKSEEEVAAMSGGHRAPRAESAGDPLLQASGLGKKNTLPPLDLRIGRGEIVGLAGLLGSGRTETARLLFGLDRADSGSLSIEGRPQRVRSPRKAIHLGMGFLPEDRKVEGIVPGLSVGENILLALQARRGWFRRVPRREARELAKRYIESLNIATPSAETPIWGLSGGNQQKAVLARWLASQPKLLILDEPTRGVDVGAKSEIEGIVARLANEGMSFLFISSELEEVVRDSHRVVVLRDREKVGELAGEEIEGGRVLEMIAASPGEK